MKTLAAVKRSAPPVRRAPMPALSPSSATRRAEVRQVLHGPRLQPKLTVGAPDDRFEREANRVADQVMRMPEEQIQRVCADCEEQLQRQPLEKPEEELRTEQLAGEGGAVTVEGDLEVRTRGLRGGGQPLPESERAFFEPRFGYDFGEVRIRADSRAAELTRSLNARAFTFGRDVVFGAGEYRPESTTGGRLLAHELAHVVQQGGGQTANREVTAAQPGDRHEREADKVADSIVHGGPRQPSSRSATVPRIQRSNPPPGTPAAPSAAPALDWRGQFESAKTLHGSSSEADRTQADQIMKTLIVHAASNVTPADPLTQVVPTVADINWKWALTDLAAFADPKRIDDPGNTSYWDWFEFREGCVVPEGPAYTESLIAHELDHASYAKTLFDQWTAGNPSGSWDEYYLAHVASLQEGEYEPEDLGGIASRDLPDKIVPSPIEFQAYVKQLLEYFHRVEKDKHQTLARGVILFYPLKASLAGGPAATSIKKEVIKVIFYNPVSYGADAGQKEVVLTLFRNAMKVALNSRPEAEREAVANAFGTIFRNVPPDVVKQAKADYQPKR